MSNVLRYFTFVLFSGLIAGRLRPVGNRGLSHFGDFDTRPLFGLRSKIGCLEQILLGNTQIV